MSTRENHRTAELSYDHDYDDPNIIWNGKHNDIHVCELTDMGKSFYKSLTRKIFTNPSGTQFFFVA